MAALTPAQKGVVDRVDRRAVARVDRLTRERIGPRPAHYDRAAQNPIESWRDLWREGFLAAAVPEASGGPGLDMSTYIAVIRTIARGCASTAMTVHMHSTVMRFIDALASDAQKRSYYEEVTRHGRGGEGRVRGKVQTTPHKHACALGRPRSCSMPSSTRTMSIGRCVSSRNSW